MNDDNTGSCKKKYNKARNAILINLWCVIISVYLTKTCRKQNNNQKKKKKRFDITCVWSLTVLVIFICLSEPYKKEVVKNNEQKILLAIKIRIFVKDFKVQCLCKKESFTLTWIYFQSVTKWSKLWSIQRKCHVERKIFFSYLTRSNWFYLGLKFHYFSWYQNVKCINTKQKKPWICFCLMRCTLKLNISQSC